VPDTGDARASIRERFLDAILNGERLTALQIVDDALEAGLSQIDLYSDVFGASLERIGDLWQANEIGDAREQMAGAVARAAISRAYARFARSTIDRGTLVVTGVAGELHQVGAELFASGWDVRFVGSALPNAEIVAVVRGCSADVLAITTTLPANVPAAVELVRDVRVRMGEGAPRIILGGAAYRSSPHIAREVGAIGAFTDLRTAVEALDT
jgi:methanogenic corrinoid protein MtbC1